MRPPQPDILLHVSQNARRCLGAARPDRSHPRSLKRMREFERRDCAIQQHDGDAAAQHDAGWLDATTRARSSSGGR
eukprot:6213536-Pleurochrysis_carterae.AAC.2